MSAKASPRSNWWPGMCKPGDMVAEDQVLADVMTDKASVEIPSPVAGRVLALGGEVGQMLAVGAELIRIEVAGRGPSTPAAAAQAGAAAAAAPAAPRARRRQRQRQRAPPPSAAPQRPRCRAARAGAARPADRLACRAPRGPGSSAST